MRLSESLRKKIVVTGAGRIINRLKVPRVYVLFFEEILANYIKECENRGYVNDKDIGKLWMYNIDRFIPSALKRLPVSIFFNRFLNRIWTNIGGVENIRASKEGDIITIKTKREFVTRIIGKNDFFVGVLEGIINALCKCESECIRKTQAINSCTYVFRLKKGYYRPAKCKNKNLYNSLNNSSQVKGFDLKSGIKKGIFTIKPDNKIYFRGNVLIPIENTLFHLLSNRRLLIGKVSSISYDFFRKYVDKNTSKEAKLTLLKNIMQVSGWGTVNIKMEKDGVLVHIRNMPYGLQTEKDNWEFLVRTILGYLWIVDRKYLTKKVDVSRNALRIKYCTRA